MGLEPAPAAPPPTTESSRAWRLADDLSDGDDPPAPKRAKSTRRPRWSNDEEVRLRTLVGELGGDKWKTIAERLGTGRTGAAVELRWAKLKAKNTTAPPQPPVVPAPAPGVVELRWGAGAAGATARVTAACKKVDEWNNREPESDEDASDDPGPPAVGFGSGGAASAREAFLEKIAQPNFVNAADRVLGEGAAARGWMVEERHNVPKRNFKEPRYSFACPDRITVRNPARGESRRDLEHFYKHWKPAREAVHMNSSSNLRVGGPEVIDAHRARIRQSVVSDPAGVFDRLRRKIEVVDEVRGPLAGIFLRIFALRQEWITRPRIEFDVVTRGLKERLPAFLRSSARRAVSTATNPWRWLSALRALVGVPEGGHSLWRWFRLTTATGGGVAGGVATRSS